MKKLSKAQIVLLLIAGFFLLWFLAPLVAGIFNSGNQFGILAFTILILIIIFFDKIKEIISKITKKIWGKIFFASISLMLVFCIGLFTTISVLMVKTAFNYPKQNSTLIVLGCQVYGTEPSRMLNSRLEKALEYLNENPDSSAVLSGGLGNKAEITEAQAMFNYLTENGIGADRLFLEEQATDTDENIKYSLKIIEDNGLNASVAIVSHEFHQYRASLIAKEYGKDVYNISALTTFFSFSTYWVREVFAVVEQVVLK